MAQWVTRRTVPSVTSNNDECRHPIHLWLRVLDTGTGELGAPREIVKACGTRREKLCPSCAAVYRRDAFSVVRSGMVDEHGELAPLTFLTLTAPGSEEFGAVHSRRMKYSKQGQRHATHYGCECGKWHSEGDAILGQPLDPLTYEYEKAAKWNALSARLFSVTLQKLARLVFGTDEKGKPLGRLEYIRVAEYQRRGLIHFHLLVRGYIDERDFHAVVRGGERKDGKSVTKASHDGISWGRQCHLTHIRPGGRFGVGAYLVKVVGYAVKSTGDEFDHGGAMGHTMRRVAPSTCACTWEEPCDAALGRRFDYEGRQVCRRHRLSENGYGYLGHTLTKSRSWGTTFREVRAKRARYAGGTKSTTMALSTFEKARSVAAVCGEVLFPPRHLLVWTRTPPLRI